MSSKNEADRPSLAAQTPNSRWSLAARLSAWYSASAFLLLLVATGFLYWALIRSFDREDDQYLTEKINVLRALLLDESRNAGMIHWEVEGESLTRPSGKVLSRVISGGGQIVFETTGMSQELPVAAFSDRQGPGGVEIRSLGKTFRTMSARISGAAETYRVQVAIDLTHQKKLLAGYRQRLWLALGFGLVASVLVGYRIGYRGVRPVKEIAVTMQHTSSATLNKRMEIAGLPSELSALAARFNQMLDRLEDAFARLSRFSSDIAHELRTPINNLRGELEVALAKARSAEEYRDILSSLLEECLRISRLIDSLLFLARSENPQTEISRERLRVGRELAVIREFYEAAASERGVLLDVHAPAEIVADVDRTLFQRAIGNLIENALAHTSPRGAVKVSATEKDGELAVSVSDTGSGIPPAHLPYVFDRSYRVDPARSRDSGGLGLGLAIVKSIASLHGGRVHIESEVGRGTQVTLLFPRHPPSAEPRNPARGT